MNRKLFWFFFVSIILLAVFFRFFKLGGIPVSLYWDEVAILADARIVAETGHDMHGNHWFQAIFPSYGDYKLPGYIWFATLAVKLFGTTEFAVRLPSALAGILTMVIAFFLVKQLNLTSKNEVNTEHLQLAILLTVATSFWSIMFSRTAFEGHLAQFTVALSVLLVFFSRKKPWLLVISALVGVFAVYTYYSVRFVWPVVFLVATIVTFLPLNKKSVFTFLLPTVISLVVFFILLVPMSRSPHYVASQQFRLSAKSILQQDSQIHEANYYRLLSGNKLIDRIFFHRDLLTLKLLASNYSKHLSLEYIFLSGDQNLRHGTTQHGLYAPVLIIPFFIGLFLLFKNNKKVLFLVATWWMISLLPASVPLDAPHALRSLNALVPTAIIISYGLTYFFGFDTKKKKNISIIFFTVLAIQVFAFWQYYLNQYPKDSALAWQDGYKQLAEKIISDRSQYAEVWITISDKRLYLWFLAYSQYPAQTIQSWEKPNFQLEKFDQIYFRNIDLFKVNGLRDPFVVVRNPEESVMVIGITEAKLIKTEYVLNSFGKPVFVLDYFDNQNEN